MEESAYQRKPTIAPKDLQTLFRVFLSHYQSLFCTTYCSRPRVATMDPTGHLRSLAFDIKHIRNLWAHQHTFSPRETYRCVEVVVWFFEQLNHRQPELEKIRLLVLQDMCLQVSAQSDAIRSSESTLDRCQLSQSQRPRIL